MGLFTKYDYLKPNRLSDVIRLISVLGLDTEFAYRKAEGLNVVLNGPPLSSTEWFEVAKAHPEFFKFNVKETTIVLLVRFLNRITVEGAETYPHLTVDQVQKMIDQAIALHDKQIARLQKNSFLVPVGTAILAAITTGLVTYFTVTHATTPIKYVEAKIDRLQNAVEINATESKNILLLVEGIARTKVDSVRKN
jgi:hypothetical protein